MIQDLCTGVQFNRPVQDFSVASNGKRQQQYQHNSDFLQVEFVATMIVRLWGLFSDRTAMLSSAVALKGPVCTLSPQIIIRLLYHPLTDWH